MFIQLLSAWLRTVYYHECNERIREEQPLKLDPFRHVRFWFLGYRIYSCRFNFRFKFWSSLFIRLKIGQIPFPRYDSLLSFPKFKKKCSCKRDRQTYLLTSFCLLLTPQRHKHGKKYGCVVIKQIRNCRLATRRVKFCKTASSLALRA